MNWNAIAAIGTSLSAIIALGIAVFSYRQSLQKERQSREKEAIEKILTPIRKDLHSFTLSKWDHWYARKSHKVQDMRLDFPLQFFWLSKNIQQSLEGFDQEFDRFDNLNQQLRTKFTKVVAETFKRFVSNNNILQEITGANGLEDENIIHAHWSCVVGGKFGPSVTLYSLAMWGKSLSAYIEERKQEVELPNKNVDSLLFSIYDPSSRIKITLTQDQSDKLLSTIEEEIKQYPEMEEYRRKWRGLYDNGRHLIEKIDSWLSKDGTEDSGSTNLKVSPGHSLAILFRAIMVLAIILGGSWLITQKLTPPDYTIQFKRECDGVQCQKIKAINSNRNTSIENDIESLSSGLERFDFFARFTFLRFDFQTTNQSKLIFAVTEPKFEKGIGIMMQCNLNGQNYIFYPNSGIIFHQKASIGNIIRELSKIQDLLIKCNPAPQATENIIDRPVEVAPNAQVQLIFNEEAYSLKFLPDKWNYFLTVLQMFIMVGIFLTAYYELKKFIGQGLK